VLLCQNVRCPVLAAGLAGHLHNFRALLAKQVRTILSGGAAACPYFIGESTGVGVGWRGWQRRGTGSDEKARHCSNEVRGLTGVLTPKLSHEITIHAGKQCWQPTR
jgi:hypothetical protein